MSKKILSSSQLNANIASIKQSGYIPATETAFIQNSFARLVVSSSLKNGGTIRSLEEINKFLIKKYKNKAILMKEKEYNKELSDLQLALKGRRTLQGEKRFQSKRINSIIEDANNMGYDITRKKLTVKQLHDAIKQAGLRSSKFKGESNDFYGYLQDIIEGIR